MQWARIASFQRIFLAFGWQIARAAKLAVPDESRSCSIGGKVHPGKAERMTPVTVRPVECGQPPRFARSQLTLTRAHEVN